MAQYFTAYRVDHILAFFRIFQIPEKHVTGALGHFRPSRALTRTGLGNIGLWDIDRLCEPYITAHILKEELGDDADEVIGKYLVPDNAGKLRFRPAYNCERALEEIPTPPSSPEWLQQVRSVQCIPQVLVGLIVSKRDPENSPEYSDYFLSMQEPLRYYQNSWERCTCLLVLEVPECMLR